MIEDIIRDDYETERAIEAEAEELEEQYRERY